MAFSLMSNFVLILVYKKTDVSEHGRDIINHVFIAPTGEGETSEREKEANKTLQSIQKNGLYFPCGSD